MEIEQAAAALTAHLSDVPAGSRSMHIVNSWVGEGEPKVLRREIHVAFMAPYEGHQVPAEFMGHPVKKVGWQP